MAPRWFSLNVMPAQFHWTRRPGLPGWSMRAFSPSVAKNPPTSPPLVGFGSTHLSAMLCLLLIQDGAERMMVLHYQITVKEYLEDSWSTWFDGLTITHAADGTTTLVGPVRDQSALYGLIDKARDLGLTLVAVGRSDLPDLSGEPLA